jgi:geranylgeranyl pyrophosphate synthase
MATEKANANPTKQQIDEHIATRIKLWFPHEIHEQIEYIYGDGKRIRPLLCINAFNNLSIDCNNSELLKNQITSLLYDYAILIELIHCISLVLDDGPQMDNDAERRNRPSFHAKWDALYGSGYHIIICYYLLAKISIIIADITTQFQHNISQYISDRKFALIKRIFLLLSDKFDLFIRNLVEGQQIDLRGEGIFTFSGNSANPTNKVFFPFPYELELYLFYRHIMGVFNANLQDNNNNKHNNYKNNKKFVEDGQICGHIINYLANSIELNIKKTASLFNIAFTTGYIYSVICKILFDDNLDDNLDENIIIDIKNALKLIEFIGNIYGILYQYNDDIGDRKQDAINKKPNIYNDILV